MPLLARKLGRLAGRHSASAVAAAAARAAARHVAEARLERALATAPQVAVGPFLGEVGYELLYWRPFVFRYLRQHGVARERVLVIGRGGSGRWYTPVAAQSADALAVVDGSAIREAVARRPGGSTKQFEVEPLDEDILAALADDDAALVHPKLMYNRWHDFWTGLRPPSEAPRLGDYEPLPRLPVDPAIEGRLPSEYIAVKAYFNECLPDSAASRLRLAEIVETLAGQLPVVLLTTPVRLDDHGDVGGLDGAIVVSDLLDPVENLAQQSAIVARSAALVSTYGGFAYVGPFLGIPTIAMSTVREHNPIHERVLRAALPDAAFARVDLDASAVLGRLPS